MISPFELPNEVLLSSLFAQFPCREPQIRALATLLSPRSPSPKNVVLYGLPATGKSAITRAVLGALSSPPQSMTNGDMNHREHNDALRYAMIKSAECITGRHLLETTVGAVAKSVEWSGRVNKCENLAQLMVEIGRLLENRGDRMDVDGEAQRKFVLVFDGIDDQRDAPPTLLPALAKMGDIIPNLTIVFIVTAPRPHFLSTGGAPHIHFQSYTKAEAITILALNPPSIYGTEVGHLDDDKLKKESKDVWTRFCTAVWDTLSKHSGRDVLSFRAVCDRLWPSFTAPLRDGSYAPKDFHRLLVAKRPLLQDESILVPSILSSTAITSKATTSTFSTTHSKITKAPITSIATQLPHTTRLLLIASYLASYTPARHDLLLFSKSHAPSGTPKRRKQNKLSSATNTPTKSNTNTSLGLTNGSRSRTRKINRKLLGPQAFVLERMLAIFHALRLHSETGHGRLAWRVTGANADLLMAFATLASLRLVVKTSGVADALDASTKWKVNVGWEVVRGLGRSVGVEVEDFVID